MAKTFLDTANKILEAKENAPTSRVEACESPLAVPFVSAGHQVLCTKPALSKLLTVTLPNDMPTALDSSL